jgi:tetratricopeptide (TPR) repeat protein
MFVWKVWPLAGIAILLALSGCGDDGGGPEILPVEEQLAAGWARFGEGNYSGAIEKFDEAVRTDPALGDGHNGLGWSYLRLDSLDVALGEFQLAVAKGFVGADAEAGRCLILNRLDEYRQAIFAGEAVLATDAAFKLEGDVTIDVRDVRLAMAQSYYALGEYVEALEQITTVDAAILINPNSATFAAELLAAIEELTGDLTSS